MAYLHARRLQPVRDYIGLPLIVTSFYRSPDRNDITKYAAEKSLHMRALAVDFTVPKKHRHKLELIYEYCKANFDYGELILYELPDGTLDSIHWTLPAIDNDRETLRYIKDGTKLIKRS
jgi:hypothetical protein